LQLFLIVNQRAPMVASGLPSAKLPYGSNL